MAGGWSRHAADGSSEESGTFSNPDAIKRALDEVTDQAIVFHGFTAYMRDYEVIVYASGDPSTGVHPEHLRYLFTHCVRAMTRTAVRRDVWSRSLDERLTDFEQFEANDNVDGYVWGVKWQILDLGAELKGASEESLQWSRDVGIPFHEVLLQSNGHNIELVFSTLRVSVLEPGYAPFVTPGDGA